MLAITTTSVICGRPCQSVQNESILDDLSEEISLLNRYEKSRDFQTYFTIKKISNMPKRQQANLCNIPVRADAVSNCLPRGPDDNSVLFVNLKRKNTFR